MSSTNKTTNYQLSQFVGPDKPAWLGDYNTDMSKIDTAIKGASDDATDGKTQSTTNKNAIGTLANLTTTVKDNLVSAINEVKTNADNASTSAVGTARLTNGAVTTEKIENGAVTPEKIASSTYTEDEQLIGKWVDGSNLYRRVISLGNLPNNTSKITPVQIDNLKQITFMRGYAENESVYFNLDCSFLSPTFNTEAVFLKGSGIRVTTTEDRSGLVGHVVLEYTKLM